MQHKNYLIVGGSAAGMAAATAIRQRDAEGAVCILSEEPDSPYFRPMIPFLISGKKRAEHIFLEGQGPYQQPGIEIRLNTRATRLDSQERLLSTASGEQFGYDKLLIATGSRPNIPKDLEGISTDGVFALRTLADAQRAARRTFATRSAVLLGGGLLNLKAAFALLERAIKVTLVVYSPEILSQLMEPEDAFLLRKALDQAGLEIITGRAARCITADRSGVTGVILDNGQDLVCQMVCIGKGVRPNCEWLAGSGIRIEGGIVVDQQTRTSAEDIYAAGDVALTYDPITGGPIVTGLWTNAVDMGRCAGINMTGKQTAYGGTFGILNATQVANMPFVSMGLIHARGTDHEIFTENRSDSYCKLVFSADGSVLVGALFVGDIAKAGLYRSIIKERLTLDGIKRKVLDRSLHYGDLLCGRNKAAP